jgi:hypothetical protein
MDKPIEPSDTPLSHMDAAIGGGLFRGEVYCFSGICHHKPNFKSESKKTPPESPGQLVIEFSPLDQPKQ